MRLPSKINWAYIVVTAILLRSLMDLTTGIHPAGGEAIVKIIDGYLAHLLVFDNYLPLPTYYSPKLTTKISTHLKEVSVLTVVKKTWTLVFA